MLFVIYNMLYIFILACCRCCYYYSHHKHKLSVLPSCIQIPPITAVLCDFSEVITLTDRVMACTSEETYQDLIGKNIFQFGLLLAALIGHCNEQRSCKEVRLNYICMCGKMSLYFL